VRGAFKGSVTERQMSYLHQNRLYLPLGSLVLGYLIDTWR